MGNESLSLKISPELLKLQQYLEESSPLGGFSLRETGLTVAELLELVETIDEIIKNNEIFTQLQEDEYFLYLLLMNYAIQKLSRVGINTQTPVKANDAKKNNASMLTEAFLNAKTAHQAKLEASRDPLTNAWTLRALKNRFKEVKSIIEKSQKTKSEKSAFFCFIDVDKFKKINDTYGHEIGDKFLIKLATLMKELTKAETDFLARIGGDEFAMLLVFPRQHEVDMRQRIKNIHHQINKKLSVTTKDGDEVSLKVSIGVTKISPEDDGLETVKDRADRLLYQSKEGGGNEICFENETPVKKQPNLIQEVMALVKKYFPRSH